MQTKNRKREEKPSGDAIGPFPQTTMSWEVGGSCPETQLPLLACTDSPPFGRTGQARNTPCVFPPRRLSELSRSAR